MRIYVVGKESTLETLRKHLVPKYKELTVDGTNDPLQAVEIVSKRHVVQPYDLLLFANNFVEFDLSNNKELSRSLNRATVYSIRDLPVYILVKDKNKEYRQTLKTTLTGKNIRLFPYTELKLTTVEEVIKEVLTHKGTNEPDSSVVADVLVEKDSKLSDAGKESIMRIYSKRLEESNADYTNLNRITSVIQKFSSPKTGAHTVPENSKSVNASIIESIKSQIFVDNPAPSPASTITVKDLNIEKFDKNLALENVRQTLMTSDQNFVDQANYLETLKEVIEEVKKSDEENKHEIVVQLIKEKSVANEEMAKIMTEFVSILSRDITETLTEEYTNELKEFGDFLNVDNLIAEKLGDLDSLKQTRNLLKDNFKVVSEQLTIATNSINNSLSSVANNYLLTNKELAKEMEEYANENNVVIPSDFFITNNQQITNELSLAYSDVKLGVTTLIDSAKNAITHLLQIVEVDDAIIDKQDEVIDTLITQKTVKTIVVDNVLQSKLQAVVGPDGVGKTQIALGLAKTNALYKKTLLVDLNLRSPNLRYYNALTEQNSNYWQNNNTIHMEEFIRIPIGRNLYSQIPFENNLTVIQPNEPMDLTDYERIINPGVFAMHLLQFMEELSLFYDRILVILPQDLSDYADLIPKIGVMYAVTDSDVSNANKLTEILKLNNKLEYVPVKVFICNKVSRGVPLTEKDFMKLCGISEREYRFFSIPAFTDSIESKFRGNFQFAHSSPMGQKFNELYKL